ncbi:MAG TPA: hypothetical protein VHE35_18220 [Kofleriaceae bacterium]|nr:hypothetical protein [Kofleriaceae bacterium]
MTSASLQAPAATSACAIGCGRARAPGLAALLALALASRAWALRAGHLDELWWLCHVATAAMIVGLALGWARVVAGAWLYHLVWGAPVWLFDAIANGRAQPSSIAAHVGPLALGGWWLARRPWPGPVAAPAWAVGIAALIVSRPLTVPAHDVNAAYAVWPPLDRVFPSVASLWIVTSLVCLASMLGADRVLVRRRGRR